jgi:transcription elongation factor GreA
MSALLLTKGGFQKLEDELQNIEKEVLPDIKKRMIAARSDGDLSENNAWITSKEEMDAATFRVAELKRMLKEAKIVDRTNSDNTVQIGDTIEISIGSQKMTLTLVSTLEADPLKKLISEESPLGKVLIGKKAGETATLSSPSGDQKITILSKK